MNEFIKKNGVWIGLVFLVLFLLGFNFYSNKQEEVKNQIKKQEKLEKIVQEHNSTIVQKESLKKQTLPETTSKEVKKEEFIYNKDYGKSEAELDGDVKAEPYTGLLPEAPDLEENDSTLLGIDSNNNGVRDDVEIEIVDMFGDDKNLVEAFFASNRSSQYAYSLAENNLLTDENIQKIMDNVSYDVECRYLYLSNSKVYSNDYFKTSKDIENEVMNTNKRRQIEKEIANLFSGQANSFDRSEKSCQEYFERTKSFKILR